MMSPLKIIWCTILGVIPLYGASQSFKQFGDPWSGLIAGLIVAGLLWGAGTAAKAVLKKLRKK